MNPGDRRALILGVLVTLVAWGALRFLPGALASWDAREERLTATRRLVRETTTALEALPRMEDSVRVLTREVKSLAPRILSGSTRAVALSDLSGRLSFAAERHHARFIRLTAVDDSLTAGPLQRVTASAAFQSDFHGLAELLTVLARDPVVTVVEAADVAPLDGQAAGPDGPERLEVQLRISAWFLAREEKS